MINKIEIQNYGIVSNFECKDLSNINLFIGKNGTGKSFLLKALYSAIKSVEAYKRGDDIKTINDILAEKLRWTFQTDRLGDLVRKGKNEQLSFCMYSSDKYFSYNFSDSTSTKLSNVENRFETLNSNSVFIPAKEILSLFNIVLKSREIDKSFGFDDTYYDLVKALQIQPQKGKNFKTFAESRKKLKDIIDGKVEYDDKIGKWYYKKSNQRYNINITSEGIKKIAILDSLLANGYLTRDSILFIDEVESALHPQAISNFLDIIASIAFKMGIQVFIASHSYFVIKKLRLLAIKNKKSIKCISMVQDGTARVEDLLECMPENDIIAESVRLYEEEIDGVNFYE